MFDLDDEAGKADEEVDEGLDVKAEDDDVDDDDVGVGIDVNVDVEIVLGNATTFAVLNGTKLAGLAVRVGEELLAPLLITT